MKKMTGMMAAVAATLLSFGLAEASGGGSRKKGIVIDPAHGPTIKMGKIDRASGPDAQRIVIDGQNRDLKLGHQEFENGKERWGMSYDGIYRDVDIRRVSKPNGVDKFGMSYDGRKVDFKLGVRR